MRRQRTVVAASAVVCLVAMACSSTARYRVLCFFFEGVPIPGQPEPGEATSEEQAVLADATTEAPDDEADAALLAAGPVARLHPPYQLSKCAACHAGFGRKTLRTVQEGLCRECHDVPAGLTFVHGPVAVTDCLFCHHHHGGDHIYMLRTEPTALCFRCHDQDDLTEGEYHDELDEVSCVTCHHGHGGDNRFFLKPSES